MATTTTTPSGSDANPPAAMKYSTPTNAVGMQNGSNGDPAYTSSMKAGRGLPQARQRMESMGTPTHDAAMQAGSTTTRHLQQDQPGRRTELRPSSPRTLRSSSTLDEETHGVGKAPKGRHRKEWPGVPYVRRPNKGDGEWLPAHRLATFWINLFYDLSVASVLSTFSSAHEIDTPSDIPTFVSYFTIIQWIWATQTYYDIRFQAEDVVHRVYKAAQICLFVYIGAASRRWDLSKLRDPDTIDNISDTDYLARQAARESFTTVMIAFILSRALLAIQYAMSATVGKQAGRRVNFQIFSLLILVVSTIITIVVLAIPASSTALVAVKIALLYLSIVIEIAGILAQLHGSLRHHISVADIAHRYGDLTLVILGEGGFNSLTRAFNFAISGLSDRNKTTFAQVFLTIGVIFMLYLFLFSWFDPEEEITEKRALVWQVLHLPMHLVILLLLSAMVNTVVVISYSHGYDLVATAFSQTILSITTGTPVTDHERKKIDRYLSRLNLDPDWDSQFAYLASLVNATTPAEDPSIVSWQYFGQILTQTTVSYGLQLSSDTQNTLSDLYAVNSTYTADTALATSRQDQSLSLLTHLLTEPLSEALSGTLWLFPFAGAALIFAGIRSSIWYRFSGTGHYIMHGGMLVAGVALALLGLLDIGQKRIRIDINSANTFEAMNEVAPMYLLVDLALPLVIVLFVYALVYFGATAAIAWRRRRHRRVRMAEESGEIAGREKTERSTSDTGA